jgi:hypothetical protein
MIDVDVFFRKKSRPPFALMRKAAMDALLLSALIYIGFFAFPAILLNYPWVFFPIYALMYLLMLRLRLRRAARETAEPKNPYNYLFH